MNDIYDFGFSKNWDLGQSNTSKISKVTYSDFKIMRLVESTAGLKHSYWQT